MATLLWPRTPQSRDRRATMTTPAATKSGARSRAGEIKSLAEILKTVQGKLPGDVAGVEIEHDDGRWLYEFRVVDEQGPAVRSLYRRAQRRDRADQGEVMRLLLVEDDRRIAADIEGALKAAGYVVETVRDGEEAWFHGDTEDYGAVVLDLGLPGMDGLAVLKRWRANGRTMPVLILTARASWAERVDGIDAGADDYLPKPFRMEELLARLRSIVRRSAGHASSVVVAGDITLDERQMKVSRARRAGRAVAAGISSGRLSAAPSRPRGVAA